MCNFEVEAQWAKGHTGLPALTSDTVAPIVQRMEELGVLLAGPDDRIVLKYPLDQAYQEYLADLGLALPTVLVPECRAPGRSTTEDLLDSPRALARLAAAGRCGGMLLPMGTSAHEQRLAEAAGLPLAVPGPATFEKVNSKIYSRRLAGEAGLRTVPGSCCETVGDLERALGRWCPDPGAQSQAVVKDAFGVSGKGLIVLDTAAKADRLLKMVRRRAKHTGDGRLAVVVEQWLPKRFDLNYQITVGRQGRVALDFVKQAITEGGVHQGHLMPAELSGAQQAEIGEAAIAVGKKLHEDGFTGVAGIDAIVTAAGVLYPVLEINARLNMSSYQGGVCELFVPAGWRALARHYPLQLERPAGFGDIRRALGPLLRADGDQRLIIMCFGTVNVGAEPDGPPSRGRLYAMLAAPDRTRLSALDDAIGTALGRIVPDRMSQ